MLRSWPQIKDYLEFLGFRVSTETGERQSKSACVFVAARAIVDMHEAGEAWQTCDLRHAADPLWVIAGNLFLFNNDSDAGGMYGPDEIRRLAQEWSSADTSDANWIIPRATSRDEFLREFLTDFRQSVRALSAGQNRVPGMNTPMRMYVTNTDDSAGYGVHWITVAVSVRWSV